MEAVTVLVVVLVSAGLDDVDPKENVDAAGLDDAVVLAAVEPAAAPKLNVGVMEGPAGFWAPPKIGTLDEAAAAAAPVEKPVGLDSAVDATVDVLLEAADFGDPKPNIPLPTIGVGLLSVLFVAAEPKLKDDAGLAAVDPPNVLELAVVVAPAANEPKLTVGFFGCSVGVSLLLVVGFAIGDAVAETALVVSAGFPNEKPTVLGASAGLMLEGEPKLNPLVVVVEVTASEVLEAADGAGLDPKLNPPVGAGLGGSDFSVGLGLSVVSEVAAGLIPKLKPLPLAGVAVLVTLVPLPKLNLGLSSELVVFVVDVTEPKVNPVLAGAGALAVELAGGTPKENPVLGAASELGGTPKLNLAPEEDDAGVLPKEKVGASSGVDPGFACSQQAHFERDASFRVIHALHSHLLADCCATRALNP